MNTILPNAVRVVSILALCLASLSGPSWVSPLWAATTREDLEARVRTEYPTLESFYYDLHRHPELSFREVHTSAKVAAELRQAGFETTAGVGGNGVVGVLRNGSGPTVLVRTDLDALPVKELTGLPYASRTRATNDVGLEVDVMHACGHDMHMAVFVGTARLLAQMKERWHGTLVMIGQPAEERGKGARQMLADGLFQRFPKPEFCLALHVSPDLAAGSMGVAEGYAMANVDSVDITIRGVGGHGAWPHRTKDPVVLAAQTVMALQTIVSREVDPLESAVVTVGSIHGGTKHNIIPDEVKLQLTVRSFTDEVRSHTLEAIRRIVRGQAISAGIPEERLPLVKMAEDEFCPATYNQPELTRRVAGALRQMLGEKHVVSRRAAMGGEDFSEYGRTSEKIPICIFWLGAVSPERIRESQKGDGKPLPSLHSNAFAPVPEPTIKTGVRAMTTAALDLLGRK